MDTTELLEAKLIALILYARGLAHREGPTSARLYMQSKMPYLSAGIQIAFLSATPLTPLVSAALNYSSIPDASGFTLSMESMLKQLQLGSGEEPTVDGGSTQLEWRRVPGYDEFEVNELGEIRENGGPARVRIAGSGHIYVLRTHSRPALLLHRGVLLAFEGPCPPGHVCRHLDDNPANNKRANLKWGTKAENAQDRIKNAQTKPGWTSERRLLERIKELEEHNLFLKTQNMKFKATIMNFIANRDHRVTQSLLKELGL